ncbi:MAG: endo,4-beta-xylanase [Candidatus Sumerlaeota bacterium]|nr:endo,4-beta-xylanase [Candidatus Sumerlaeota bacterium]
MKSFELILSVAVFCLFAKALSAQPTLREAYEKHFLIGVALSEAHYTGEDPEVSQLITSEFNTVTAEVAMKWKYLHPHEDVYTFESADRFVEFGETNGMAIIGHTLIWHNDTPDWVFLDDEGAQVDRETLLKRMRDHIHTVMGHYRGRVKGWDVVNEALEWNGEFRDCPWLRIIGEDYLIRAFEFAREADPDAELYYNDFGLENEEKRIGALRLLRRLKDEGILPDGIGIQGHVNLNWPSAQQLEDTLNDFAAEGVKVMITEMDVDVLPSGRKTEMVDADATRRQEASSQLNPYQEGLPEEKQQELATRYAELFSIYLRHSDTIDRITFWGLGDGESWLNEFPIEGRTNYPLLFDRKLKKKPAYYSVISAAQTLTDSPSDDKHQRTASADDTE